MAAGVTPEPGCAVQALMVLLVCAGSRKAARAGGGGACWGAAGRYGQQAKSCQCFKGNSLSFTRSKDLSLIRTKASNFGPGQMLLGPATAAGLMALIWV